MAGRLCLILGDQLSPQMASLRHIDKKTDIVALLEVKAEATYVKHHQKKIVLIFSAMRQFAESLRRDGYRVHYSRIDDPDNTGSFATEIERLQTIYHPREIIVAEPGEWRVWNDLQSWAGRLNCAVTILPDDRFYCSRDDFAAWAKGRKYLRMEHFYRDMRKRHGVLMEKNGQPAGGAWNYDADNRKTLPEGVVPPPPAYFHPNAVTQGVIAAVQKYFGDHFGTCADFHFATNAADAEAALADFISRRLPQFGDYQDAMRTDDVVLFHSYLAMYLNIGLLDAKSVVRRIEAAYWAGTVPLNAAEGFIRQILGWREYVRGIYWLKMPGYAQTNFFKANRHLPDFYWTGDTDMRCLAQVIGQTKQWAYAHHIQRLMVTGNFALLYGAAPKAVEEWYLLVYADAFEWVELPNTHGMALYADGGVMASKPYAASGKYIDKMSDYCADCRYDVRQNDGPDACPFNYLYWNFLITHRGLLANNARMGMMYKVLDKMPQDKINKIRASASRFIDACDKKIVS